MVGLVLSLVMLALFAVGTGFGLIDRFRGRPWVMRASFARKWHVRHMSHESYPLDAFDQWLAEWRETRVKAGVWLDRQFVNEEATPR